MYVFIKILQTTDTNFEYCDNVSTVGRSYRSCAQIRQQHRQSHCCVFLINKIPILFSTRSITDPPCISQKLESNTHNDDFFDEEYVYNVLNYLR